MIMIMVLKYNYNNFKQNISSIHNPFLDSNKKNNFPALDPMFNVVSDDSSDCLSQYNDASLEYKSAMNNQKFDVLIK